ncbi:MAG: secondary thiamine-phosphate synthase enzyme YjbQ [Candidatus Loosdrechtia sp.]|uniref:YjbQ family protein n=1 Tax=Candidatus Loosdrechtia sp. TaxID=3101272 RepID=UPI003A6A9FC7|nr:MAG: secondary thiamine-phosphate synthase enzyme YjbQ [Candidatus Jettenia sp. AMX2]
MKFLTEYITFHTKKRREFINITRNVVAVVEKCNICEGMVLVSALHITSGVFINDAEPGLHRDIEEWLLKLIPEGHDYYHHRTGEVNGDAHLRNLLIGHQVIVPVTHGKLDLGTWQQIFYAEFDGQRSKRLTIKAMGE